jgi:hypothetical protein
MAGAGFAIVLEKDITDDFRPGSSVHLVIAKKGWNDELLHPPAGQCNVPCFSVSIVQERCSGMFFRKSESHFPGGVVSPYACLPGWMTEKGVVLKGGVGFLIS